MGGMIVAKLFPWFPLAGKASDAIVILLGIAIVVAIVAIVSAKRGNGGR